MPRAQLKQRKQFPNKLLSRAKAKKNPRKKLEHKVIKKWSNATHPKTQTYSIMLNKPDSMLKANL